ncbi:hypothetical protein CEUSTIGMA_g1324.t1 [Chlamydomonas eustigma]|uniref:Uncharacterized protein n=1 Tax=Chlamydomonas eustigma TaxID=1157962 RepID=A0A250WSR7_9CHLO|nr:hypothetical protein CEUSTIGMA_g1324.t1 [Chlamydomonas eustigma]|eukprot:GAX73874.1 hypothetical protein CEUSTIGMA_g1324.t1 [Chlamydomonas eustigma]
MRELSVYPIGTRAERQISRNLPSELQLEEALEAKEGSALYVQHKLLSRALTVAQTTRASQILCGISEQVTNVHFLFVFKNAGLEIDNTSTFNIVIPSKDDE